ncbi:LysE family transporter [Aeromonas dhakensis]|uniref:LysE family translocator n=1 Tax=Aeromonas dhakensis TaxID=196024 RepID=UPI000399806B|nr:LysE family transporter [Aeromonas dhakensis]MDH0176133.1 LysE family transporter [Aeromonas dhakensis]MED7773917.1 LysE family transporter [Aeromonas dhakensis]
MFTSLFLTIGLIHLIALASPGPDFALILRTSLHRPTALGAALGIALAILVHATLSLTGISLLIAEHPWLFMTVKVVGALYLGWLGWGALKAAWHSSAELALHAGGEAQGWRKGVQRGIATNLLNPKALLFFMGLLAAMVTPQVDGLTRGLLVLELFLLSLVWFGVLAWSLSTVRAQRLLGRVQRPLNLVTGLLFGAVSLSILTGMAGEASALVLH